MNDLKDIKTISNLKHIPTNRFGITKCDFYNKENARYSAMVSSGILTEFKYFSEKAIQELEIINNTEITLDVYIKLKE